MQIPSKYPSDVSCRALVSRRGCPAATEWVLVLDDDAGAGRALARWVRHITGLQVRVARTIHQANCSLATLPEPMAILTDFELQDGENGVVALQRIRVEGCKAPAAMVTGAPDLALYTLATSELEEVIPVFSRAELHDLVRDWLEQLALCWSVPKLAAG